MKHINDYLNNRKNNESTDINEGVKDEAQSFLGKVMKTRDINQVTFEDVLKPLAEELDIYSKANARGLGDLEYSNRCLKLFKDLVECMAVSHEESVYESEVNEGKKYSAKDVSNAWNNAFGEDIRNTDRADVIDDIKSDYSGKVTVEELEEIYDERYGDELESEFLDALTESNVNEGEGFKYSVTDLAKELSDEFNIPMEFAIEHAKGLLELGEVISKDDITDGDLAAYEFGGNVNGYAVDVDIESDEDGGTVNVRIGDDSKSFDFTGAKGKFFKACQTAVKFIDKETK